MEEKNKFLNAQNLAQLAKDTSFIAIMAVGMTIVALAPSLPVAAVGSEYGFSKMPSLNDISPLASSGITACASRDWSPPGNQTPVTPSRSRATDLTSR